MNTDSCDMIRVADDDAVHDGPPGSFCIETLANGQRIMWHKLPDGNGGLLRLRPVVSGEAPISRRQLLLPLSAASRLFFPPIRQSIDYQPVAPTLLATRLRPSTCLARTSSRAAAARTVRAQPARPYQQSTILPPVVSGASFRHPFNDPVVADAPARHVREAGALQLFEHA